jgi:hypothetical protein
MPGDPMLADNIYEVTSLDLGGATFVPSAQAVGLLPNIWWASPVPSRSQQTRLPLFHYWYTLYTHDDANQNLCRRARAVRSTRR